MEKTFTGKQLILNEINTICTEKSGISLFALISRFQDFNFLDGLKYVNELHDDRKIRYNNGFVYAMRDDHKDEFNNKFQRR